MNVSATTKSSFVPIISIPLFKRRARILINLILAILYGFFLASLPLDAFKDRVNYLTYASAAPLILERHAAGGLLTILSNEPVWLLLNSFFGSFFSPEEVVRLLIFVPASMIAWMTLQHRTGWVGWAIVFLLFPAVIKNHIIHLRQGVAVALFLWGWYHQKSGWRWLLWLSTPFIHSSFFFVLAIYGLVRRGRILRLAPDLRMLIVLCATIGVSLSLPWLAAALGARQAFEYNLREVDVSGLGFLFWSSILILFLSQGRRFLREHLFEMATLVFYLGTYFFGAVSARIFESTLLLVLFSGLHLKTHRRTLFLGAIIGFMAIDYWLRLSEPWLGWGF